MTILVGTSGWRYDHWDGVLYPAALPPQQRLDHYFALCLAVDTRGECRIRFTRS